MTPRLDMFARMLANENISVVYDRTAKTATFATATRVLTCPMWQNITRNIHILFIAHEVSHAKHTPHALIKRVEDAVGKDKFSFKVLNIVEDVRIENLSCLEYPKIAPFYKTGYMDLISKGFWKVPKGATELDYDFVMRINIQAKLRDMINVKFTQKEQEIYDFLQSMRTTDDVVEGYKKVIDYIDNPPDDEDQDSNGAGDSGSIEGLSTIEGMMADGGDDNSSGGSTPSNGDGEDETEVGDVVSEMMKKIVEENAKYSRSGGYYGSSENYNIQDARITPTSTLRDKEDRKTVQALVMEFQRRKNAVINSRSSIRVSGDIAQNLLHKYPYDDNLFRVVGKNPKEKNHGITIMADISGSMSSVIKSVFRRISILTDFADLIRIPYVVYAFTDGHGYGGAQIYKVYHSDMPKVKRDGIINATTTHKTFPLHMGGTPLVVASKVFMTETLEFKEKKKLDMITAITLTDGGEYASNVSNMYHKGTFIECSQPVHPMEILNKHMRDNGVNTVHHHIGSDYVFQSSIIRWSPRKEDGMIFSEKDECFDLRIVEKANSVNKNEKIYARMIAEVINNRI